MAKRIVLGVDGSKGSRRATTWCAAFAKTLDAQVVAVHAVDPSVVAARPRAELEHTMTNVWCKPLQDEGVDTRTLTIDAAPAGALLAIADDCDADLVVVGRRGEGGFEELLLGSVPSQLALYSKRPVVIIPEGS
jgi:nucleotide-binding universal stress UspA family protein